MKVLVVALSSALVLLTGCETSTSVLYPQQTVAEETQAWVGVYKGKLPCADCSGIYMTLTLSPDKTYKLISSYEGTEGGVFQSQGKLTWSGAENIITLVDESGPNQFLLEGATLVKLDINGEKVTGSLAEFYVLHKEFW